MRQKRAFFQRETEPVSDLIDLGGQSLEICGGIHPGPKHAGAFLMREKPETSEFEIHPHGGTNGGEYAF